MILKIRKGLDIPIKGNPSNSDIVEVSSSSIAMDFKPFKSFKIKTVVKEGEEVLKNQVISFFKNSENIKFLSPCNGLIKSIHRGPKRILEEIIIEKNQRNCEVPYFSRIDIKEASKQDILNFLSIHGAFSLIKMHPFSLPAIPQMLPKDIFINLAGNEPFSVPINIQILSFESQEQALFYFEKGIEILSKIISKKIHLIYRLPCLILSEKIKQLCKCTEVIGPYPSGCTSLHIYKMSPIISEKDIIWSLSFNETASIGYLTNNGYLYNKKIMALAGPSLNEKERRYIKIEIGSSLKKIVPQRINQEKHSIILGSPLSGILSKNIDEDHLGLFDNIVSVIPKNQKREFFHFLKIGSKKFTATRTYLSGFLRFLKKEFDFTTNQHGELRAFIDPFVYNSFAPMNIHIVNLAKAILAENFDLAKKLGFLEISKEDCALATFICPSKNNILEIIQQGQEKYVQESDFLPFH